MNKKANKTLIDESKFKLSLIGVHFDRIDVPEDVATDTKFISQTEDRHKILKITKDQLVLEFTREKFFEPAGIFELKVSIKINYKLNPNKDINSEKRRDFISKEIEDRYSGLLAPAATVASILVSSITAVDWKIPMVDPPFPIKKKKD